MNINELRKYFYNSKEFVIRFRDDKDIVYYNGIRAMNIIHPNGKDIKQETYELIPNVYRLNKAFLISKRVRKNLKNKKYENAKYFKEILSLRNNLINISEHKDNFLKVIKKPQIIITRENHEQKDSLIEEKRIVGTLLKELEDNKLNQFLKFSINKEFILKDLSNVSYEDIENLRQSLDKLFNFNFDVFYKKIDYRTLKKGKKDYQAKIKKQKHSKDNYDHIKYDNNLGLVEVHFVLAKATSIQDFERNYLFLSDFNQNNNAKVLFNRWNYSLKDTIEICLNKDTPMTQILLIELLVLRHWILDKECNYIDTTKIHRKKPEVKILQCSKNLVEELNEKKLNSILSKIKKGIKHYELYIYEGEKNYQHQFMLDRKTVDKLNDKIHSDFLYPFEEEYYTSNSEDDDEKLGRIDNIFLDIHENHSLDVYLIELKYNEQALGGTNGLHTHLNDIKNLFTKKNYKTFEKKLKKYINNHFKIVHNIMSDTKLPTYINEICRYHFLIVIGYEKNKKDLIKDILNIYNDENYYKNPQKFDKKIPLPKLKNSKLTTLNELCMKIPKDKCDVKLFLDEVHNDKDKVQITEVPLEEYEL